MRLSKISHAMVQQGKLTFFAKLLLTLFGFGIIYLSLLGSPNMFILIIGLSIGFVLVSLVAYSNKAESLDLPAPFTNDPLGWRRAKESYKNEDKKSLSMSSGQADAGIQKYIMDNTKNTPGYMPNASPYVASNASLNKPTTTNTPPSAPTASCANGDTSCISGVGVQQNAPISAEAVANTASALSRQAGVVAAGATAATAAASPQVKPITGSVAVGATVIGVAADAVEQMARPDTGQVIQGSVTKYFQEWTDKKIPGAAPITNEIVEAWRASGTSKSIGDWTNQQWEAFLTRTAK